MHAGDFPRRQGAQQPSIPSGMVAVVRFWHCVQTQVSGPRGWPCGGWTRTHA